MMSRSKSLTFALFALAFLLILPTTGSIHGAVYTPCQMPTVVGFGTKPNVMIVMDYSGSMQFPAYQDFPFVGYYSSRVARHSGSYDNPNSPSTTGVYDRQTSYYGTFKSDTYYVYDETNNWWEPASTQPVTSFSVTNSSDGGGGTIEFDAAGHDFQVNDVVAFSKLSSHLGMNGKAFTVVSVSGSKFKITASWNGTPDKEGEVIKRIDGAFTSSTGISGNILNYMITTRVDAALAALIGAKADCDADDGDPATQEYCYLRNQGARRYFGEYTNLYTRFYVRPATLEDSAGVEKTYPNDYSSGTYIEKNIFLTTYAYYTGKINGAQPIQYRKRYQGWKFTLTKKTRVKMRYDGNWDNGSNDYLVIYSGPINTSGDCTTTSSGTEPGRVFDQSGNPVTVDQDFNPGTYYVRATYSTPSPVNCPNGTYELWSNVPLEKWAPQYFLGVHNGVDHTPIGAIPSARIYVKIPKEERLGVIQKANPYVRFGFTYYKNEAKAYRGKIAVGCHRDPNIDPETQLRKLVNAFQGVHENLDAETQYHYNQGYPYTKIYPYHGTPTGPAMEEQEDYFSQHTNHNNATNDYYTSNVKGTARDPYYDVDVAGNAEPVPCRKSFVILISDGEWNWGSDPTDSALKIHTVDVRPDNQQPEMVGEQLLDVYSIFAFDDSVGGENSMKTISMYGSFTNKAGCGSGNWPFDEHGYPSNSLNFAWPRSYCNPAGTYDTNCCEEWDKVWDRNEDGVEEDKGVPDTYYKANNGAELEAALLAVLQEVISRNAAASAVATVSQQGSEGDLIVRGAFEASDPDILDKYLWRGHVDSYWPIGVKQSFFSGSLIGEEPVYEFGCPRSLGLLCYQIHDGQFLAGSDCDERQIPGESPRCIDFSYPLTSPSYRRVFTGFDTNGDGRIRYATPLSGGGIDYSVEQEGFNASNISWLESALGPVQDCDGDGDVDTQDALALLKWVLGEESDCFRSRTDDKNRLWAVGDVVFSTPVVSGVPPFAAVLTVDPDIRDYYRYRNSKVRELTIPPNPIPASFTSADEVVKKMVYVGANDGMLHAFILGVFNWDTQKWVYKRQSMLSSADDPTDAKYAKFVGEELWSYIPTSILSELKEVCRKTYGFQTSGSCVHRTMVDLSPIPWQVYMRYRDENGQEQIGWRTVIVGGLRGGGDLYFAVDVTNPDYPVLLWEYSVLKDLVRATGTDTYEMPADFVNHYNELKLLPLSWARPYVGRLDLPSTNNVKFYTGDPNASGSPSSYFPIGGKRHVAFVGGGFRIFDELLEFPSGFTMPSDLMVLLRQPHFLALDIETGENLFRYVWVELLNGFSQIASRYSDSATARIHPKTGTTITHIPQALGSPMAYDLLKGSERGRDGFVDHIYLGDMNGYFYGMKFNFVDSLKGIKVDVRLTKYADVSNQAPETYYRSLVHPITVAVAASREGHEADDEGRRLEGSGEREFLRVIFGTGKFDNMAGANDDKTDTAKMSLYNMRDLMELPTISANPSSGYGGEVVANSGFYVNLDFICGDPWSPTHRNRFDTGCEWTNPNTGEGDCCESNCNAQPCWDCVYDLIHPTQAEIDNEVPGGGNPDLKPGERVINKAVIRDGWVFVTTYRPPAGVCDAFGPGYLYIFDYLCRPFLREDSPLNIDEAVDIGPHTNSAGQEVVSGLMVNLSEIEGGALGIPSPPVIDSSGAVIIQLSNASIIRIPATNPGANTLLEGWRER